MLQPIRSGTATSGVVCKTSLYAMMAVMSTTPLRHVLQDLVLAHNANPSL